MFCSLSFAHTVTPLFLCSSQSFIHRFQVPSVPFTGSKRISATGDQGLQHDVSYSLELQNLHWRGTTHVVAWLAELVRVMGHVGVYGSPSTSVNLITSTRNRHPVNLISQSLVNLSCIIINLFHLELNFLPWIYFI